MPLIASNNADFFQSKAEVIAEEEIIDHFNSEVTSSFKSLISQSQTSNENVNIVVDDKTFAETSLTIGPLSEEQTVLKLRRKDLDFDEAELCGSVEKLSNF